MTQPTPRMLGAPDGSVSLATGRGVASLGEDVVCQPDTVAEREEGDDDAPPVPLTSHLSVVLSTTFLFFPRLLTCADSLPELGKPFPRRITKLVDNGASSAHRFADRFCVNHYSHLLVASQRVASKS